MIINNKKARNDIVLISAVILLALISFFAIYLNRTEGGYAQIIQNGVETDVYPLDKEAEIDIPSDNGGYNRLIIKDGCAEIVSASCPDGLCISQGKVKFNGETIVCLPNKLVIKIVSGTDPDVDIIS